MAETDREFTPMERELLEYLVSGAWEGEDVARAQIDSGRHGGVWGPGDPKSTCRVY